MSNIFVEIGSCDFDNLDILLLNNWTGYFIEPVPVHLNSLKEKVLHNTHGKKIKAHYCQCAISNYTGKGSITYISPETNEWSWWVKGISHVTGYENNAIQQRKDEFIEYAKTVEVDFFTLDDFLIKEKISSIEIMNIDVEGHELNILNNYSWRIKPRHIKIEHKLNSLVDIINILQNQKYIIEFDDEDVYGIYYE